MKNLIKFLGLFLIAGIAFVSCESDTGMDPLGPDVSVATTASELTPGQLFSVTVTASSGDAEMNALTILENGSQLSTDRISEISGLTTVNNPALLFDADRNSFSYNVTLQAAAEVGTYTYTFRVTDADNEIGSNEVAITVVSTPATIEYNGSMTIDEVPPSSLVSLQLDVTPGTLPLNTIAVYEDAELIMDASRLELGTNGFDVNPYTLPAELKDGFSEMLFIRVPGESGTKSYTVEIADESGVTSTLDVDVIIGTPVDMLEGVLFNAGGPQGTGGLDLDTGTSTNSDDPNSEIKDLGIDLSLPLDQNWLQRIAGINGFEARYLTPGENGLPETFSFEGVSIKEQIPSLWDNAVEFTSVDTQTGELVSRVVQVGEVFIVSDGTSYYTFIVKEVNVKTMDNSDNYVLDIKF